MTDFFCLGKFVKNCTRPSTMQVTLSSVLDRNILLQSDNKLSDYEYKFFMTAALCDSDIQLERKVLKKRWQLITSGVDRKDIKVRGLRLYVKGEIFDIDEDCPKT